MNLIGYWQSSSRDEQTLIHPRILVKERPYDDNEKAAIVRYMQLGVPCNHYRGFSGCRICGKILGTHERTDGKWVWPDKMDHYVDEHNIALPEEFLHTMSENNYEVPNVHLSSNIVGYDTEFWCKWSNARQTKWLKTQEPILEPIENPYENN